MLKLQNNSHPTLCFGCFFFFNIHIQMYILYTQPNSTFPKFTYVTIRQKNINVSNILYLTVDTQTLMNCSNLSVSN